MDPSTLPAYILPSNRMRKSTELASQSGPMSSSTLRLWESEATAPSPEPLGVLSKLPAELRANIIQHYISHPFSIGLFLANHRLYLDMITHINEDFELTFLIDPTDLYARVKILTALSQPDRYVACLGYHRGTILDQWPVDRFKRVKIIIEAPDPKDPGQLVRCWRQATGLVSALGPRWKDPGVLPISDDDIEVGKGRMSTRLPPITIDFQDIKDGRTGTLRQWTRESPCQSGERLWNHSVPSYEEWHAGSSWHSWSNMAQPHADSENKTSHCDLEIILTAFLRLRFAKAVKVTLPIPAKQDGRVNRMLDFLKQTSRQVLPIGLHPRSGDGMDDDFVMIQEDAMHLWLDLLLDDLRGRTAGILRRQRWQAWCCEYEYLITDRLHGRQRKGYSTCGGAKRGHGGVFPYSLTLAIRIAFRHRLAAGRLLKRHYQKMYFPQHFWGEDSEEEHTCANKTGEYCHWSTEGLDRTLHHSTGRDCEARGIWEIWDRKWPEGMPMRSVAGHGGLVWPDSWTPDNPAWDLALPYDRLSGSSARGTSYVVIRRCGDCVEERRRRVEGVRQERQEAGNRWWRLSNDCGKQLGGDVDNPS